MRWLTIVIVALALALAGVGCGGSNQESAATTEAAVSEETTTDESATESTTDETTTEGETEPSGAFASADCLQAMTAFGVLAQAAASVAGVDPGDSLQTFQEFTDNAPGEIQDDLKVLATAYGAYIQTLNDLGLKQGETPNADQIAALSKASEPFNTSEFQTASQNWDDWIATNCPNG
jgi:hypothetical protein